MVEVVRKVEALRGADAPLPGYEPTRSPRVRAQVEPPPLPAGADLGDGFGAADEDGLRMLAALETLSSLEPDYSDDLTAEEASVTIIEAFDHGTVAEALGTGDSRLPYTARRADEGAPALLLNGYETFMGVGEEASVEIVEVGPSFAAEPTDQPPPTHAGASLAERLATTGRWPRGRFFKALSGD